MPEMNNVATGETIASQWGNDIRDRTVQRYVDAAERASEHPSPAEGDLSYLTVSNDVWVYNGTAWVEIGDLPISTADLADGGVTTVKIANGAVTDVKVAGNVVDSFTQHGAVTSNPLSTLTTSFANVAQINFMKPVNWTNYEVSAWGSVTFDNEAADTTVEVRIAIGAAVGTAASMSGIPTSASGMALGAGHSGASLTGDRTISIQARRTTTGTGLRSASGYLAFFAIRET